MGGGDRHEQLAMGDTPNIAARLQGLAAPDTVVLSAVTARLVQRRFALETLGTHQLKGVTEPMPVFQVLGLPDTADDEEAATPGRAVFLVGRDEELGLLRRRWEQSKAGLGQVVLIRARPVLANRPWWRPCGPRCAARVLRAWRFGVRRITPTVRSIR